MNYSTTFRTSGILQAQYQCRVKSTLKRNRSLKWAHTQKHVTNNTSHVTKNNKNNKKKSVCGHHTYFFILFLFFVYLAQSGWLGCAQQFCIFEPIHSHGSFKIYQIYTMIWTSQHLQRKWTFTKACLIQHNVNKNRKIAIVMLDTQITEMLSR